MIPQALNIAPHAVTYRQLYFWHKALVIGAVAKASVVMLPGIQAARATEVPTLNVSIMLKKNINFRYSAFVIMFHSYHRIVSTFAYLSNITPYDLIIPAVQNSARNVPRATNHPYPPSGGIKTSLISSSSTIFWCKRGL